MGDYSGVPIHNFLPDVTAVNTLANSFPDGNHASLYNGNIAHMITAISDQNEALDVFASSYRYDQLQQLKEMNVLFDEVQTPGDGVLELNTFAGTSNQYDQYKTTVALAHTTQFRNKSAPILGTIGFS